VGISESFSVFVAVHLVENKPTRAASGKYEISDLRAQETDVKAVCHKEKTKIAKQEK